LRETGRRVLLPGAHSWYRKRLRYIVARWGAETALWAINSWNDCSTPQEPQLGWLREMRDYVHSLTKGWRPLVYGSNFAREANAEMDYAQAGTALRSDRPNVTQECHFADRNEWFIPVLREQLWHGLARGKAAVMVWPHATVDRVGAWDTFRPVMDFMRQLPLLEGKWHPVQANATQAQSDTKPPYRTVIECGSYGDIPTWGVPATRDRFEIDPTKGDQWLMGFCPNLYGRNRTAWRRPPTFAFTLPGTGALILNFQEIGAGDQTLAATVDGKPVEPTVFKGGRRLLKGDECWVRFPLAAGPHEVRVDNAGADWLRMRKLYVAWDIATPAGLVQTIGRSNGDVGFLYVRNLTYSRVAQDVLGQKPQDLRDIRLAIDGLAKGARYAVRIVNTGSGEGRQQTLSTPADSQQLMVPLDRLAADAVIRFERKP
jgi:hypothetical protein